MLQTENIVGISEEACFFVSVSVFVFILILGFKLAVWTDLESFVENWQQHIHFGKVQNTEIEIRFILITRYIPCVFK